MWPKDPDRQRILDSLVRFMRAERPPWRLIDINIIDPRDPLLPELLVAFRRAGLVVRQYVQTVKWHQPCRGLTYESYRKSRPRSIRKGYARKWRKLQRERDAAIEIFADTKNLETAINAFKQVWAASWKVTEYAPRFSEEFIRSCAPTGLLRIGVLRIDGQPVAAEIMIVAAGQAVLLKGAYDRSAKTYSPGGILLLAMIEHALDANAVESISFGRDDEAYKKLWADERSEVVGIAAFNPRTISGLVALIQHLSWEFLNRLAKQCKKVAAVICNVRLVFLFVVLI